VNEGGQRPALVTDRRTEVGRRRVAPKAIETSDVTRFRGVGLGAIVAVIAVLGAIVVAWVSGADATRPSPRALSLPHRDAGLTCESCHVEDYEPQRAIDTCVTCHPGQTSRRAGHADLLQRGIVRCTDCHPPHEDDAGVRFSAEGNATRYGQGTEVALDGPSVYLGDEAVTVPLPPARACGRCHTLDAIDDPATPCLPVGLESLAGSRPIMCLDEHRDVLAAAAVGRTAAWEAARAVAIRHPTVEASAPQRPSGGVLGAAWVGSGFFAGMLALGLVRLVRRARQGANKATTLPSAAVLPAKVIRLPQINTNTCIGCHACVDACPYDVLEVHAYIAQVVRPDDCCGLTLCEQRCPNGSLVITDGNPIEDRPHMSDDLESIDSPGVYLAGDLTGLPLIRNAINQGTHVTRTIAAGLGARTGAMLDLVIVGSGPAGMSAALAAKSLGLSHVVLEQASVAESIRSFPRGKLVFDQPLGLPLIGDLWLEKATKEELLAKWQRIVHVQQLAIREYHRVTSIERISGGPPSGHLRVHHLDPNGQPAFIETRRVLLAFGRRGSPRKLPIEIPEAAQSSVHYSLADARSFADHRVVVVGLGDVAMEAAIAIAKQPGTAVTVSYRGDGFKRGKGKNVKEVKRLAEAGRITLALGTQVTELAPGQLVLQGKDGRTPVPFDALFVMVGTIAPWQFLDSCGVRRVSDGATPAPPPAPAGV
jgi:thioredoxin reductase/NAD-dependent dihydropyrimidine dehydrogenase PreA subunit